MKKLFLFCTLAAVALAGCKKVETTNPDNGDDNNKPGIEINGIRWAEKNVDKPGTFAATAYDAGMFYQWNRITAWSSTDPMKAYGADGNEIPEKNWDSSNAAGDTWAPENDPCPTGWRMPTKEEFEKLYDTEKVTSAWVDATETTPAGRTFTDKTTNNSIFFPATGYRNVTTGGLSGVGSNGNYWSASPGSATGGYYLYFYSGGVTPSNSYGRGPGFAARCVAE